jgi:hypothetical protein
MAKAGKEETAEGPDPGLPKSVSGGSAAKSDDEGPTLATAAATVEPEAPPPPDSVTSTASSSSRSEGRFQRHGEYRQADSH